MKIDLFYFLKQNSSPQITLFLGTSWSLRAMAFLMQVTIFDTLILTILITFICQMKCVLSNVFYQLGC
jgi:hypothetical protein